MFYADQVLTTYSQKPHIYTFYVLSHYVLFYLLKEITGTEAIISSNPVFTAIQPLYVVLKSRAC